MILAFVAAVAALATASAAPAASRLFSSSPTGSQTISYDGGAGLAAIKAGWFDVNGTNDQGNPNYVVSNDFNRNFFVFDTALGVTSATIDIGNDPLVGLSLDPAAGSVTWTLYDIDTITAAELASGNSSTGRTDVYADLGSGIVYGLVTISAATGSVFVALNAAGLAAIETAAIGGERFAFGGALTENAAVGGVPEPRSWALLIAGFTLVGTSLRRRRAIPA